jgi:hypothetical protein
MKAHAPETYDEITRMTVLEPDGSVRPLPIHHAAHAADLRLREEVCDALFACGFPEIGVEVDDGRVILRGWARRPEHVRLAQRIAATVAPEAIIDVRISLG